MYTSATDLLLESLFKAYFVRQSCDRSSYPHLPKHGMELVVVEVGQYVGRELYLNVGRLHSSVLISRFYMMSFLHSWLIEL